SLPHPHLPSFPTRRSSDLSRVVMKTAGAHLHTVRMNLRQRILSAIAHPNIAYLLLSIGTLGLTIELWSPGAVLPGVVGAVSLLRSEEHTSELQSRFDLVCR